MAIGYLEKNVGLSDRSVGHRDGRCGGWSVHGIGLGFRTFYFLDQTYFDRSTLSSFGSLKKFLRVDFTRLLLFLILSSVFFSSIGICSFQIFM